MGYFKDPNNAINIGIGMWAWINVNKAPRNIIFIRKTFNMYRPHCKSENLNLKRLGCGLQCHKILNEIIQPYKIFQTAECIDNEW